MRPLKDRTGPTFALEADAIDLLRAARGHEVPPGQKQRVRARLFERRVTRGARLFRPVGVIAIVLLAGASSWAVGRNWIERSVRTLIAALAPPDLAPATPPAPIARTTRSAAVGIRVAEVEKIPSQSEPLPRVALPAVTGGPTVAESNPLIAKGSGGVKQMASSKHSTVTSVAVGVRKSSASRVLAVDRQTDLAMAGDSALVPSAVANTSTPSDPSRAKHSRAAGPSDETGLVFDAMYALRQEGRSMRASRLLDEYLRRYPSGALAEEALALSIEAAMTRGDPRAKQLILQYFARYPSRHFEAAVETARARLSP